MAQRLSIQKGKTVLYDIHYQHSFGGLYEVLENFALAHKKVCIVTDTNVEKLYGEEVKNICEQVAKEVILFSFPAGEESKTLATVENLYQYLIQHKFDRSDMLIALGGGVVGDLTGYAAATYLRGVSFIQIPTTLLAQVDSSIGGKTGVDVNSYKNMVGAFHMPKAVYANLTVLQDLDERQFFNGIAEVMKAGLIKDLKFYTWLISNLYEICEKEIAVLEEMVVRSCIIKKNIVEKDPFEKGERALLNLGHTIGHAIEKELSFQLLHGECISLGIIAAAYISYKKEYLTTEDYYEIRDMFVPFNLPISIKDLDVDKILQTTKTDKKMSSGQIQFVLLKKIGRACIDKTVTDEEIKEAIKEINYKEEDDNE